ncbi:hypothetical protein [Bradyrhizobium sp. LMTR 3]|uniref:hypothetical protein n=1 Tax=Bradyrhizobium sp. LMTR 3 TaxID=189873 RepID=UPI0011475474|nr:hypothetical protein [Bradyrhizobium sp. LMTR 3]
MNLHFAVSDRIVRSFPKRYFDTPTLCWTTEFPSPSVGRSSRLGGGYRMNNESSRKVFITAGTPNAPIWCHSASGAAERASWHGVCSPVMIGVVFMACSGIPPRNLGRAGRRDRLLALSLAYGSEMKGLISTLSTSFRSVGRNRMVIGEVNGISRKFAQVPASTLNSRRKRPHDGHYN